jgi:hypothetical protein
MDFDWVGPDIKRRARRVRLIGLGMAMPILIALAWAIGLTGIFWVLVVACTLAGIVAAVFGFALLFNIDGIADSFARNGWFK